MNPFVAGSSPLTRGKRVGVTLDVWRRGLIPAHAGKTSPLVDRPDPWTAHPRSRGENVLTQPVKAWVTGSSPLTRGKRLRVHGRRAGHRLIPAHAGKTRSRSAAAARCAAHPRSRGENRTRHGPRPCRLGSSPLTRGKPRVGGRRRARLRLIPAHAGKTCSRSLSRRG